MCSTLALSGLTFANPPFEDIACAEGSLSIAFHVPTVQDVSLCNVLCELGIGRLRRLSFDNVALSSRLRTAFEGFQMYSRLLLGARRPLRA